MKVISSAIPKFKGMPLDVPLGTGRGLSRLEKTFLGVTAQSCRRVAGQLRDLRQRNALPALSKREKWFSHLGLVKSPELERNECKNN